MSMSRTSVGRRSLFTQLGAWVLLGSAVLAAQFGWLAPLSSLLLFVVVSLIALAFAVGLLGRLWFRRLWRYSYSLTSLFCAIFLGLIPALLIVAVVGQGWSKPLIHDVSTDVANPPLFRAAKADRLPAHHSVEHQGVALVETQQAHYRLQPLLLPDSPSKVHRVALRLVHAREWRLLSQQAPWSVEAVAVTGVFGFEDDVVVRITPHHEGTRVDMRSASRVGQGDFGVNAARVAEFLRDLRVELSLE